jgi:murein DD-endopeptidase MepM/ murein hydrolase activator NlpD
MKAVDTLVLQSILDRENGMIPSSDLYAEWENSKVHNRQASIPDNFTIDLREFSMPTVSRVVTSNYGPRWGRTHEGLDIKVYIGDTIRAAFSGKVRIVRNEGARKGYGKYIVIRHNNGLETIYGHLSKWLVDENQEVRAGDPIALGGNTGRSTGSHLHFETRLCGVALNPAVMFDFKNQDVVGDTWTFNRSTYNRESAEATRLRGTGGVYRGGDGLNYAEVPTSKSQASSNVRYHKVKSGETLSAIARKHHTTVTALCNLNRIKKTVTLRPGQILKYN